MSVRILSFNAMGWPGMIVSRREMIISGGDRLQAGNCLPARNDCLYRREVGNDGLVGMIISRWGMMVSRREMIVSR
jgi:hypothetical protein